MITDALARRAARAPRWRYQPGMRVIYREPPGHREVRGFVLAAGGEPIDGDAIANFRVPDGRVVASAGFVVPYVLDPAACDMRPDLRHAGTRAMVVAMGRDSRPGATPRTPTIYELEAAIRILELP